MSKVVTTRRSFLIGLGAGLVTAPAIVRAASLMPVKAIGDSMTVEHLLRFKALMERAPQRSYVVLFANAYSEQLLRGNLVDIYEDAELTIPHAKPVLVKTEIGTFRGFVISDN